MDRLYQPGPPSLESLDAIEHHPQVASRGEGGILAPEMGRSDGREFWLSLPFGTGIALTTDEIALLVTRDNPYWDSETFALVQARGGADSRNTGGAFPSQGKRSRTSDRVRPLPSRACDDRGSRSGRTRSWPKQIFPLLVVHI